MKSWHSEESAEVLTNLDTRENGLSENEVQKRLASHGLNVLRKIKGLSAFSIIFNQFKNILVVILLIAAAVSALIGDTTEFYIILAIVIINAALGFVQEFRAERTIGSLRNLIKTKAIVIRDGSRREIDSEMIVPGDIVVLNPGYTVPADTRIMKSSSLKIQEAALTGESVPSEKSSTILKEDVPVTDMENMAFMGTQIVNGTGLGVVVETGMGTQLGNIASLVQQKKDKLPFETRMQNISRKIGIGVLAVAVVVLFSTFIKSGAFTLENFTGLLLVSVALAVAAVPEGLPAVVTISLAHGIQKMARRNAVIRKLPAVETLGSVSVICTDKTGTLTKNEMTVQQAYCNNMRINVTGSGYEPKGSFFLQGKEIDPLKIGSLKILMDDAVLCNDAELSGDSITGDPTEGALLSMAAKAGLEKRKLETSQKRNFEMPFDSSRRLMTTVNGSEDICYTKGALESVLDICDRIMIDGRTRMITSKDKRSILAEEHRMAQSALRVIAFSYKESGKKYSEKTLENGQVFLGIVGMIDPPREEIKNSIEKARSAGIRTIMVTGDHKETAKAIGLDIGLLQPGDEVVDGQELKSISDKDLSDRIRKISVFSRVPPEMKMKIISALKRNGHVVAMTGDGVNDAPALKKSDVGIAMGITGTDVSKDASDMILLDDNYSSIIGAIEEGRGVFDNMQKFINYLFSSNVGEVIAVFLGMLFAPLLPLLAVHILWINLVTDGFPAVSLAVDPIDEKIMERKPRPRNKPILDRDTIIYILTLGAIIGLGTLGVFFTYLPKGDMYARTVAFTTLVVFQIFNTFNCRTDKSIFKKSSLKNRFLLLAVGASLAAHLAIMYTDLSEIFEIVRLNLMDWVILSSVSLSAVVASEVAKQLLKENIIN